MIARQQPTAAPGPGGYSSRVPVGVYAKIEESKHE
jgi:hypothetical protein